MRYFFKTIFLLFVCFTISSAFANENEKIIQKRIKNHSIDKFQAHTEVEKLKTDNLKKIKLIEIISLNFGYTFYEKLKKDYWAACILVSQKEIVQAQIQLQKNKEDIDENLKIISADYYNVTQQLLDECIDKVNELVFSTDLKTNPEKLKKLSRLKDTIRIANLQFDTAHEAYLYRRYVSSISLYRGVKTYAISILKDIVDENEMHKLDDKFKIHVVDNRNEIYKKEEKGS